MHTMTTLPYYHADEGGTAHRYFATPLVRASVTKKLASLIGMEEKHFTSFFDIRDLVFDTWNDVDVWR